VSLVERARTTDAPGEKTTEADQQAPGRRLTPDRLFWLGILAAVALGAAVRSVYLFNAAPEIVLGDGLAYQASGHRLADGLGYTAAIGDIGAPNAHHPPGWTTVLGAVSRLGGRSVLAHQLTGVLIGLGVILVAGLVGRRYAGRRVGMVAAFLAAVYPGFWVIDAQILSEPLGLLVLGLLMLVLADLWDRPTLARAVLAGAVVGGLALVRGEQLALLAVAVVPVLLLNQRLDVERRLLLTCAAVLATAVVVAPWTIHNLGRFEEPFVISTNGGSTMLAGNCPPRTYRGELIGSVDNRCTFELTATHPGLDRSELDAEARGAALGNMRDNVHRLPATVLARYGRLLGVFRPTQTVQHDAAWFGSATWPVWAWIASFWVLAPVAVAGGIVLQRSRRFHWPLVAPVVIVVAAVTVTFGDPRYHTMADLGAVVLAAVAVCALVRRLGVAESR
jgi:4-amino-4-deoxy-L-arabinose transferase-like glycosyltransferase